MKVIPKKVEIRENMPWEKSNLRAIARLKKTSICIDIKNPVINAKLNLVFRKIENLMAMCYLGSTISVF